MRKGFVRIGFPFVTSRIARKVGAETYLRQIIASNPEIELSRLGMRESPIACRWGNFVADAEALACDLIY